MLSAAARIGWRELRSARARAVLIVIAITVSIASVGGVGGAASVARQVLEGDSRAWLAADLCVDTAEPVDQGQSEQLDALRARGIDWSLVTTSFTMASSDQSADPAIVFVKAVDPGVYPFYGSLTLDPAMGLTAALANDEVVVSKELLDRLRVAPGSEIFIGNQPLRISARIVAEPDRFAGQLGSIGLRCILSRTAYDRLGFAKSANAIKDRVLIRNTRGEDAGEIRGQLERIFSGGSIRDFRGAYRQQTESVISFLAVAAFLALVVGAMGVAAAVGQYLDALIPKLAVMKVLGARPRQVAAVAWFQIVLIVATAMALAIPLGYVAGRSILAVVGNYLALPPGVAFDMTGLFDSMAAGVLAMAPSMVEPLRRIQWLPPAVLLRAGVERTGHRISVAGFAAAMAGCAWLAFHLLRSWRSAALLTGALLIVMAIAFTAAASALYGLRRMRFRSAALRHGLGGLDRPGNRNGWLIAILATGLTLMIATFELGGAVARAVLEVLPYDRGSLYVAGFRGSYREPLRVFLAGLDGVDSVAILSETRMRLLSVDGVREAYLKGEVHTVVCDFAAQPDSGPARMVLATDAARLLDAHVGTGIEFDARNHVIHARVAEIRRFTPAERFWSNVRMDCSGLDDASLFHQAAVRVRPEKLSSVRGAIAARYPTLAVVSADEISETVANVSRDAMTLTRVVAWYALASGWCVLIAVIAGSRRARLNELGILSSLGARRGWIVRIYTTEFAAIGLITAGIASLLTVGFTMAGMAVIFRRAEVATEWRVALTAATLAIVSTVAAAWLPTFSLLRRKPAEILRRY